MDDQILRFIAKCCSYDISKLHTWTRLTQVTSNIWYLVTQLEQQFGCSLSDDKVKKLLTVGDLINVIKKSGDNSSSSSSNSQQTSREELYRKAQKYLENSNYPSALQTFRKIANDIDSAKLSINEQEFINLIKQLSAISGLTSKKYGVLRRAGNRLNIEDTDVMNYLILHYNSN